MDEFAMGSNNMTSGLYPYTVNPIFEDAATNPRTTGGSSGGSAAAVAAEMCDFALGSDTGGSVRLPAAYCGVVGFKPTYGAISRHGLVAYAQSLDTVGICAKDVATTETVYKVLNEFDERDPTSLDTSIRKKIEDYQNSIKKNGEKRKYKIGVIYENNLSDLDEHVRNAWVESLETLRSQGHEIVTVSVPSLKHALPTYFVVTPSEASSNLARYDGIRYGHRAETDRLGDILYASTRSEGFCEEVQRRIILGVFNLSSDFFGNHFQQAQKVRRKIQMEFNNIFSFPNFASINQSAALSVGPKHETPVDVVISPASKTIAPTHEDIKKTTDAEGAVKSYVNDVLTVCPNIAGLPAISIPWGSGPKTIGMQVIGQFGDDNTVLDVARILEKSQLE